MARCKIYRYSAKYKNNLVQYFNSDISLAFNGYMPYGLVKELKELLINTPIELRADKQIGFKINITKFETYLSETLTRDFKCNSAESFLAILRFEKYGKFGRNQEPQQTTLF